MTPSLHYNQNTCPDPHELSAFLDGELSPSKQVLVEQHLLACPTCVGEYEKLQRAQQMVQTLPVLACPDDVVQQSLSQINETQNDVRPVRPTMFYLKRFAIAATVVVTIGLGSLLLTREDEPQYTTQEIEAARAEVMLAFSLVNEVSRETGSYLSNDILGSQVVAPITNTAKRNPTN